MVTNNQVCWSQSDICNVCFGMWSIKHRNIVRGIILEVSGTLFISSNLVPCLFKPFSVTERCATREIQIYNFWCRELIAIEMWEQRQWQKIIRDDWIPGIHQVSHQGCFGSQSSRVIWLPILVDCSATTNLSRPLSEKFESYWDWLWYNAASIEILIELELNPCFHFGPTFVSLSRKSERAYNRVWAQDV